MSLSSAAVHAITQTHNAKSMVAKMSQLRQKIEVALFGSSLHCHCLRVALERAQRSKGRLLGSLVALLYPCGLLVFVVFQTL